MVKDLIKFTTLDTIPCFSALLSPFRAFRLLRVVQRHGIPPRLQAYLLK